MKILCDFHHGELYESILKVFEDRFGGKVYRPIGYKWFDAGCWKIGSHPDQLHQYLTFDFSVPVEEDGVWLEDGNGKTDYFNNILDVFNRGPHRRVTFDKAREMKWDLIITTLFEHFDPMEDFRRSYCPTAKHILQLGNVVHHLPERAVNVMNSTGVDFSRVPNYLEYYQEFDTAHLNWEQPTNGGKALYCFLILNSGHRGKDYWKLAQMMPDWEFKEYGSYNREENIHKYAEQCRLMRKAGFLWHVKLNGDGYGYNLYRGLFAGKPLILNYKSVYHTHRLAKNGFFELGKNIINYDDISIETLHQEILQMHTTLERTSLDISKKIREYVNFDAEAEKIKKFLETLI